MKYPPNYIVNVQQHTAEWLQLRCGSVTASRVGDVTRKRKRGSGELAARATYRMEKLIEIVNGRVAEHFVSMPMMYGIENEGVAREVYAMNMDVEVERIGFIKHPTIEHAGCSPDGLISVDGLVELKVPTQEKHLEYLLDDVVPEEYLPQCHWQLACSGRDYVDFVSYDPRTHAAFNFFRKRLYRDEKVIAEMEEEVRKFIGELNDLCGRLLKHSGGELPEPMEVATFPGPERAHIPTLEGV